MLCSAASETAPWSLSGVPSILHSQNAENRGRGRFGNGARRLAVTFQRVPLRELKRVEPSVEDFVSFVRLRPLLDLRKSARIQILAAVSAPRHVDPAAVPEIFQYSQCASQLDSTGSSVSSTHFSPDSGWLVCTTTETSKSVSESLL